MALNRQYGIGLLISGREEVSDPARKAERVIRNLAGNFASAFRQMRQDLGKTREGMDVFNAGLGVLKKSFGLAMKSGQVEQELVAVQAIMGVSTARAKELANAANDAALKTQFSSLQAAQALRSLAQAGVESGDAMKILVPALNLAAASLGKITPDQGVQILNSTMKVFGLGADQAVTAANSLVNTTNRFSMGIEDLRLGIGNISRGALTLGQNMDDTLIALGLVKNIMPQISKSATLTSSAMLRVADPSIQKQLKKMGVEYADANGKFLPFIDTVWNLNNALLKQSDLPIVREGIVKKLLGAQGIAPFKAITKQLNDGIKGMDGTVFKGGEAIKYMRLQYKAAQGSVDALVKSNAPAHLIVMAREVAKHGGAAGEFVSKLLGTFKGQVTLVEGAWGVLMEAIGKPFAQVLKPAVGWFYGKLTGLIDALKTLDGGTKRWVAGLVLGSGAVISLVGGLMAVKAAFVAIAPFAAVLALVMSKALIIGGALAALGYGLYRAWTTNLFGIQDAVGSIWSGMKEGFGDTFVTFRETFDFLRGTWREMEAGFGKVFEALGIKSKKATGDMGVAWGWLGYMIGATAGAVATLAQFVAYLAVVAGHLLGVLGKSAAWILRATGLGKGAEGAGGVTPSMQLPPTPLTSPSLQALGKNEQMYKPAGFTVNVASPVVNVASPTYAPPPVTLEVNGREIARTVQEEQNDAKLRGFRKVVREGGL